MNSRTFDNQQEVPVLQDKNTYNENVIKFKLYANIIFLKIL